MERDVDLIHHHIELSWSLGCVQVLRLKFCTHMTRRPALQTLFTGGGRGRL